MVDTSKEKEEFGLVVEADSYTVEDGSEVLAKVGVVGTIAGESDFLRIGEKALLGVGHEGHDLVGEFAAVSEAVAQATAITDGPARLLFMNRENLSALVRMSPDVLSRMKSFAARHVSEQDG